MFELESLFLWGFVKQSSPNPGHTLFCEFTGDGVMKNLPFPRVREINHAHRHSYPRNEVIDEADKEEILS